MPAILKRYFKHHDNHFQKNFCAFNTIVNKHKISDLLNISPSLLF